VGQLIEHSKWEVDINTSQLYLIPWFIDVIGRPAFRGATKHIDQLAPRVYLHIFLNRWALAVVAKLLASIVGFCGMGKYYNDPTYSLSLQFSQLNLREEKLTKVEKATSNRFVHKMVSQQIFH